MEYNATVVNVVATAALGQRVDLDELGKSKWVIYDQDIYGGLVAYLKPPDMKGKVSIFASGKMISVGTKSEEEAIRELADAKKFLIQRNFIEPTAIKPRIRNVVAVADFGTNIDLETLARRHNMLYEPEQFPGGIIRIKEPSKATALIFASGKAVIAGLESSKQIDPILHEISNIIAESG